MLSVWERSWRSRPGWFRRPFPRRSRAPTSSIPEDAAVSTRAPCRYPQALVALQWFVAIIEQDAKKPRLGEILKVRIDSLTYGGDGVGRVNGLAVFIPRTAPGDEVRARITKAYRRHLEASLIAVEEASPERASGRCAHYSEGCGGCSWQHVEYAAQCEAKVSSVRDALVRLARLEEPPLRPMLAPQSAWYYRNKMEFAFHPDGVLGLHPKGAWYEILPLRECHLCSPAMLAIAMGAQAFVRERGISRYDPRTRQGLLRELVVRQSASTGEILVGIVTGPGDFPDAKAMAEHLAALDSRVAGVVHSVRRLPDSGAPVAETVVLFGVPTISEILGGMRFRLRIETFFQTNSAQAERLVQLVKDLAGDVAGQDVVDVYCGVGVFALALASQGARVTGVDVVHEAIQAARENARESGIEGARFVAGDARKVLAEVLPARLQPKVLVLDPPRAGAGGKVMRRIARSEPARIIYVSCNPTTLARDLVELSPFGYRLVSVTPLDLFPQTYHVESVAVLERVPVDPGL